MSEPVIDPEGPECEWKVRLPANGRLAHTLCAFANGVGGTLWIGVADDGRVAGLEEPAAVGREVERLAAELDPPVRVRCSRRRVGPSVVLEVRVERAADGPVGVRAEDGSSLVYVRDGSSSRPASAGTVRAMRRDSGAGPRLEDKDHKLLRTIAGGPPAALAAVARDACMSERAARRRVVRLAQAGLVQERPDRRLWLTPAGHRKLKRR